MQGTIRNLYCLGKTGSIWIVGEGIDILGTEFEYEEENEKYKYHLRKLKNFTQIVSISSGYNHIIFLDINGDIWGTGTNEQGQLGLGDFEDRKIPTKITLNTSKNISCTSIYCGEEFSIFIDSNYSFWGTGKNEYYQLGLFGAIKFCKPTLNEKLKDIDFVACGKNYTFTINSSGIIFSFGRNQFGQLGLGTSTCKELPTMVLFENGCKIISISCGHFHSLFLSDKGIVYACGLNSNSQLGKPDTGIQVYPRKIKIPKIRKIDAGTENSICIDEENNLWSIGTNSLFTKNTFEKPNTPFKTNYTDIYDISVCYTCTIIKDLHGSVYFIGKIQEYDEYDENDQNIQETPLYSDLNPDFSYDIGYKPNVVKSARK